MTLPSHIFWRKMNASFDKIRMEYNDILAALLPAAPFLSSLLSRVKVAISYSVKTAGVTKDDVMLINPEFWKTLSSRDRAWIISHEVLHIAFRDFTRASGKSPSLWNLCCDAVNNELLSKFISSSLEEFSYSLSNLHFMMFSGVIEYGEFIKVSKEELYGLFRKVAVEPGDIVCPSCGSRDFGVRSISVRDSKATFVCKGCRRSFEVDVIFASDGEVYLPTFEYDVGVEGSEDAVIREGESSGETEDDRREFWKNAVAKAYTLQKSIGKVPGELERIVKRFLESKVDWKSLLRQSIRIGLGRTAVETWKKPGRRCPDSPGIMRFTFPDVWVLVDTSGSIDDSTLEQFAGEIYAVAGISTVKVVPWDAIVYQPATVRNRSELFDKLRECLKGYGGTVCGPALEYVLSNMRYRDIVLMLSDGYIDDIESQSTRELFDRVAAKASMAFLVTTDREPKVSWNVISIKP